MCRDKLVGMSLASELGCLGLGVFITIFFRFVRLPLLEVSFSFESVHYEAGWVEFVCL